MVSENHVIRTERDNNLEINRISWERKQFVQHV
jgi:hypothetical protein